MLLGEQLLCEVQNSVHLSELHKCVYFGKFLEILDASVNLKIVGYLIPMALMARHRVRYWMQWRE